MARLSSIPSSGLRIGFDIDGVLADFSGRFPLAKAGRIDDFYREVLTDKPIRAGVSLCKTLMRSNDVWLVTGRPESTRKDTVRWLKKYVLYHPYTQDWYARSHDWIRLREQEHHHYIDFKINEFKDIGYLDLVIDDDPAICKAVEDQLGVPTLLFRHPEVDLVSWWVNYTSEKEDGKS